MQAEANIKSALLDMKLSYSNNVLLHTSKGVPKLENK